MLWKNSRAVRKRASGIIKEVHRINEEEEFYKKRDLPEYGEENDFTSESLKVSAQVNEEMDKKRRVLSSRSRKLKKKAEKLEKYFEVSVFLQGEQRSVFRVQQRVFQLFRIRSGKDKNLGDYRRHDNVT